MSGVTCGGHLSAKVWQCVVLCRQRAFIYSILLTYGTLFALGLFYLNEHVRGEYLECEVAHSESSPAEAVRICRDRFISGGHIQSPEEYQEAARNRFYVYTPYYLLGYMMCVVLVVGVLPRVCPFCRSQLVNELRVDAFDERSLGPLTDSAAVRFVDGYYTTEFWILVVCDAARMLVFFLSTSVVGGFLGFSPPEYLARVAYYVTGSSWGDSPNVFENPMYQAFPRSTTCELPYAGFNVTVVCFMRLNAYYEPGFVTIGAANVVIVCLGLVFFGMGFWKRYLCEELRVRFPLLALAASGDDGLVTRICKYRTLREMWLLSHVGNMIDGTIFLVFLRAVEKELAARRTDCAANGGPDNRDIPLRPIVSAESIPGATLKQVEADDSRRRYEGNESAPLT